uniref:uncharacterized protein LOC122595059 isoform X2 n=1 Tax=Erigeron canadensis TaxID=72917 RepID=UPI001CB9AA7B|nr:uncharacterized protein LOC122595059 isoform X2 [Erigeron canadensis]
MPEANKSESPEKMTEYEKQRMKRIQENTERMKALGLHNLAASTSSFISNNKKGKKKLKKDEEDDDEDYKPKDDDFSSSSESGEANDDEDYHVKPKLKKSTPSKKVSKLSGNSGFVVDDDALMKAIALSLQDSPGFLDVASKTSPQRSDTKASRIKNTERKQIVHNDDSGRRKRKNLFTSRVQMTEDELILHFFQFDGHQRDTCLLQKRAKGELIYGTCGE